MSRSISAPTAKTESKSKPAVKDETDPAKALQSTILAAANEVMLTFAEGQIAALPDPGVRSILQDVANQQRQKQLATDLANAEASADPLGTVAKVVAACLKAEKDKSISPEASLKLRTQAMALRVRLEQKPR